MTGRCLPCLGHSASVPLWVLHSRCGVLPPPGDAGHYPCAPSVAPTPASPGLPTALRFCLWCPVGSFQEGPSTSHPSPSLASQLGEAERKAQPSVLTGTVLPLNVSSLVVVWAHGGGGGRGRAGAAGAQPHGNPGARPPAPAARTWERIQRPSPSPPPSPSQPLSRGPGRGWEYGGRGRSTQAGPQPWGAEGIPV